LTSAVFHEGGLVMTKNMVSKYSTTEDDKASRKMSRSLWALSVAMIVMILAWAIVDRLVMFTYPDARTGNRPRNYRFTRVYNVKRNRNVNSGINLGIGLERDWGRALKEKDFDAIHDAGFYYVRIPIQFLPYLVTSGDTYQIDQSLLTRLDWVIGNILQRDMIAILDFHFLIPDDMYAFASQQDKIQREQKFLAVWEILSERYKEYPSGLYFELANEPRKPITSDMWNEYVQKAILHIRGSGGNNTTRMVIVGTNILIGELIHTWDQVNGIHQLQIPPVEEDPNIIVTFHYYEPVSFTYQGQTYTEDLARVSDYWMGNTWDNTDKQREFIRKDFDVISQWAQEHQRNIVLGEFGVGIFADTDSQINWTTLVREEAETRGMIWIFWQLYDDDVLGAIYNQSGGYWKEEVLNALIPDEGLAESEQNTLGGGQGSTGTETIVQELSALLKDPEWTIRKNAAISLADRGPEAEPAMPALVEALSDEEWQVREPAAKALASIGPASQPAVPMLIKALSDEEWLIRESAAQALTAIGPSSQPAIPALIEALSDEEWHVRESAAQALGAIGTASQPAIPALTKALSDEEWQVREPAMLALAAIAPDDPDVLAALQASLNDPEDHVRRAAAKALKMIDIANRPLDSATSPGLVAMVVCGVVLVVSGAAWVVRRRQQP
jgi:endoglucanase